MWKPTEFWIVENGELVKYVREGECNRCGECCKAYRIGYRKAIDSGVSESQKEGDPVEPDWSSWEGWSMFLAQGTWWYFITDEVTKDGAVCCPRLTVRNVCDIWKDEEKFKPICRYWPYHPKDLEYFPSCGFSFRRADEDEEE